MWDLSPFRFKSGLFQLECDIEVTRSYFKRYCKTQHCTECFHHAKHMKELHEPFYWMQKQAVNIYNIKKSSVNNINKI